MKPVGFPGAFDPAVDVGRALDEPVGAVVPGALDVAEEPWAAGAVEAAEPLEPGVGDSLDVAGPAVERGDEL